MQGTPQPLPEEPVILHGIISQLSDQLAEAERERCTQASALELQASTIEQHVQRIDQLLEYIELLRRKRFGPSADRIPAGQLGLFDETELEALIGELEAELPADTPKETDTESNEDAPKPPKRKPVRRPLPSHLARVARIIDLSDEEKLTLGEDWTFIGYDTSEQLAVIPRQRYVIEYKRAKYVARDEDVPGAEVGVKIAPRPAQIIPKSIAHSSLLAAIVTNKFVDALPLYRQEQIFAREGITLSRQTLSGLLMQLQAPLQPVAAAFKALLRQGPVVHVDETPVQVLREPGREAEQQSYMWVFCGGPPEQPVRWFEYAPSRAAEVPHRVLFPADTGPPVPFYLHSDGYSAYKVLANAPEIIGHAGCWAHVRRKFVEAAAGRNAGAAQQMVALIGELYALERRIRDADVEIRVRLRAEHSRPILMRIRHWLDKAATRVLPKGLLGQAIAYALGQWPILITFLDDGRLELDNNTAENAIRPFVLGRKNWLFAGSDEGGKRAAIILTVLETAARAGVDLRAYVHDVLVKIAGGWKMSRIDELLPKNWAAAPGVQQ